MASQPDSENQEEDTKQRLNITIEGRLIVEQNPKAKKGTEDGAEPADRPRKIVWYRRFWRWLVKLTNDPGAFITALATIVIAIFTAELYCVSSRQWRTLEKQAQADETPYVSLGRSDGIVMELVPDSQSVLMYFQNSGKGPALNIHIQAWSNFEPPQTFVPLARWKAPREGLTPESIRSNSAGPDLAPNSIYRRLFQSLSAKQINDVNNSVAKLIIGGMADYCDTRGEYHCRMFSALYQADIATFIATDPSLRECPRYWDMAGEITKQIPVGASLLAPCESPAELTENQHVDEQIRKINETLKLNER